ncbi:unnamed protein product (macronuclear) [Paramecium tetraurelia]|uniref:Uncharacterized protein n=1 Tax=Paramecium tetraurelia TaxID=5888 RepID=A0BJ75_PARTE|nr:uncharacterized protein GSPATT00004965001 [Paramecium tetraurelia]CAK58592.1 unnamed protein product [Paramecium tetraurelia]|eukprot:XP_001425990.1 hypothetical protein (macronuclear) [Paramecium tetraurelia strain d4-2]
MQQSLIDSNIIQSTTVKTIKELKKLGDSRTNLEADENEVNDSTLSGKNTPEDETSKTQNTKITLNKKPKLTFKLQTQNRITSMKQTVVKTTDDVAEQSNGFRKASLRQGSLRLQRPQPQLQLESNDPVDMNNALNLILTKCKTIKEEFEQLQLTNTLINKYIKNDKHFHFSFQAFLDNLVSKGKLAQTLTNIQKPVLQRIELFTINHVKRCIQKNQISQQFEEKTKHVDLLFNRYYKELTNIEQNIKYF